MPGNSEMLFSTSVGCLKSTSAGLEMGYMDWLHSLTIDNGDNVRAVLLIRRFLVCYSFTTCRGGWLYMGTKNLLDLHQGRVFCYAERVLLLNRLTSQSFYSIRKKYECND